MLRIQRYICTDCRTMQVPICSKTIFQSQVSVTHIFSSARRFLHLSNIRRIPKSHYDVLGLKPTASRSEIRTAYIKLSKELHPDKNPDKAAHDKFLEVNSAYEVLKDESKRRAYDFQVSASSPGPFPQRPRPQSGPYSTRNFYESDNWRTRTGFYESQQQFRSREAAEQYNRDRMRYWQERYGYSVGGDKYRSRRNRDDTQYTDEFSGEGFGPPPGLRMMMTLANYLIFFFCLTIISRVFIANYVRYRNRKANEEFFDRTDLDKIVLDQRNEHVRRNVTQANVTNMDELRYIMLEESRKKDAELRLDPKLAETVKREKLPVEPAKPL